jgi:hypothetical protein
MCRELLASPGIVGQSGAYKSKNGRNQDGPTEEYGKEQQKIPCYLRHTPSSRRSDLGIDLFLGDSAPVHDPTGEIAGKGWVKS